MWVVVWLIAAKLHSHHPQDARIGSAFIRTLHTVKSKEPPPRVLVARNPGESTVLDKVNRLVTCHETTFAETLLTWTCSKKELHLDLCSNFYLGLSL